MKILVKTAQNDSFTYELSAKRQDCTSCFINVFKRALKSLSGFLYALNTASLKLFGKISAILDYMSFQDSKVKSVAFDALNHAYSDSNQPQKQALSDYIASRLTYLNLEKTQLKALSHKIAHDKRIYDIGGLCLGYSWLFAAFILKEAPNAKSAKDLHDRFISTEAFKLAPIISFANYADLDQCLKVSSDEVTLDAKTLNEGCGSLTKQELALDALKDLAFPSLKIEEATLAKTLQAKIHAYKAYTALKLSSEVSDIKEALSIRHEMNKKFDDIQKTSKLLDRTLHLHEQIYELAKANDKKALVFGIPTDDENVNHAMCIYASEEEKTFVFFDSNTGIYTFPSLHELAKGVSLYSRSNYGAKQAIHFDAFSI